MVFCFQGSTHTLELTLFGSEGGCFMRKKILIYLLSNKKTKNQLIVINEIRQISRKQVETRDEIS